MDTATGAEAPRKTIFLVDDDLTNLMAGKKALSDVYEVFTLNSGARLLKALEKSIPDLVLLDVEMPEMNGYEVIKALRASERTAGIPVIFLTAKSDCENELEGLTLGAIDYIIKPFSPPLLLKRIEVHLLVESQKRRLEEQTRELTSQKLLLLEFNDNLQGMVEEKTRTVVELRDALLKTMADLVECRDVITGGHIERTQKYLEALLKEMLRQGIYAEELASWDWELVLQSAQLHDVGKIMVKDSILNKPGRLTPEEFEEIKKHTTFGGTVIQKIRESTSEQAFLDYAEVFAVTHHEKWDGSGYPAGLKGKDIPLLGRLMALADVYDALRSDRPYKKAFSRGEAEKIIIEGSGTHFDPAIVDLFLCVSPEFHAIAAAFLKDGA
ncbi:MAG: response regulator [Chitinispirillia bacterium]|nr:response regulator [Chitinispirillia bacterium]MCL2241304.1 response regulator [Chitinispirillia bacterium]